MVARRSFLLRVDPDVLDAVQRWANDDLRSLNGQIEFLLRSALRANGRLPKQGAAGAAPAAEPEVEGEGK
ncbi:MAG: hypothetical protein ABIT38_14500 [Gemmatimonadaceae bacterium]